jgi:hypothetical protein
MKTERRHELQTNVLAHSMARWIEVARPYSKAGTAVLIAIVVALFAWAWMSTQGTRRAADGWNEYFDATGGRNSDPRELLRDISSRYSGTMVAQWARLSLADIQLDDGTNRLLQDRALARDDLREASEKFQALLLESSHATILQRSTYGLARAHEAMGDLERARKEYRSVASQWPDSPFAATAEARAKDLDEAGTKNFYDWLAKYEPPPPLTNEPGKPGVGPSFLEEPDAGGILDMPPKSEAGTGPSLPTVIGPESEEQKAEDEPKPETAPEAEQSDQPAPEEKPPPEANEAGPELK